MTKMLLFYYLFVNCYGKQTFNNNCWKICKYLPVCGRTVLNMVVVLPRMTLGISLYVSDNALRNCLFAEETGTRFPMLYISRSVGISKLCRHSS